MQNTENMNKIKTILVADDHPLFRAGVVSVLKEKAYTITGEASDGEEALRMLKSEPPDVLIVDMEMPKLNGMQVLEQAAKISPGTKTVLLTMFKETKLFNRVMDLGVSGYILKESAVVEIHDCLEAINRGDYFISPALSSFLVQRLKKKAELEASHEGMEALTDVEKRILRLIAQSRTSHQIADELFISKRTVDKHRENICTKLNIHGSLNLTKFAIENKHSL
jgi:DNA-binding NarL/FixJ family response regulator